MYRRPKFLELLLETRREMALEVDYDVDLFVEVARNGHPPAAEVLADIGTVVSRENVDAVVPTIAEHGREIRKG
jgi:hypothetical protein